MSCRAFRRHPRQDLDQKPVRAPHEDGKTRQLVQRRPVESALGTSTRAKSPQTTVL